VRDFRPVSVLYVVARTHAYPHGLVPGANGRGHKLCKPSGQETKEESEDEGECDSHLKGPRAKAVLQDITGGPGLDQFSFP